jgi:hypothetical protein
MSLRLQGSIERTRTLRALDFGRMVGTLIMEQKDLETILRNYLFK